MKTLKLNPKKLLKVVLFLFVSSLFLFINGCQKDELVNVAGTDSRLISKSSQNENVFDTQDKSRGVAASFLMLVIDHSAARTSLPDYRVELISNGNVLFNGRRNTAFAGIKKYTVNKEIIQLIKDFMDYYKFSAVDDLPFEFDIPIATTTYRSSIESDAITRMDYNNSDNSNRLIQMRDKLELILGVSGFVHKTKIANEPTINPNHLAY